MNGSTEPVERFTLLDDEELSQIARPEWVIRTIIPYNALVVVIGPPKSLKSFLALMWAFHVATGMDWHDQAIERSEVVYVYAEGAAALQGRMAALKAYHGVTGKLGILFLPRRVLLNEPAEVEALLAAIKAKAQGKIRLIIIDTQARNSSADENSTDGMSANVRGYDRLREETGATVLVVHHEGHAAEGRGRGSSVLPAAADTLIKVTRDGDRITLENKFQKDAPEFGMLSLEAIPVGSSLVLKPCGVNSGRLTGNRLLALRSLHESFGDEGSKWKAWKEATALSNGPFSLALTWLKANAYVKADAGRYRITEAGRQALTPHSTITPPQLHNPESAPLHLMGVCKDPMVEQDQQRGTEL